MKRIAAAIACVFMGSGGLLAADLPARMPTKAPVIVDPGYNWTGFYAGVNIGYSWGRSATDQSFANTATGAVLNASSPRFDLDGVIGGGQIGYNVQANRWVFGVEADIQASGQKGNGSAICAGGTLAVLTSACTPGHVGDTRPFDVPAFPVVGTFDQKLEWFGTVRGRVGPTLSPTVLAYLTGGLAYGDVSATNAVAGTNITGANGTNTFVLTPAAGVGSQRSTLWGWTVGAGLEGVVSGNWTAKIEYLYMDLGNISGTFVTPLVAPGGAFITSRYTSHITDNIVRVGLNYRWGGPVVAKY